MSSQKPKIDWLLNQYRITLFPEMTFSGPFRQYWDKLTDKGPQKEINNAQKGEYIYEGVVDNHSFIMIASLFKIDVIIKTPGDIPIDFSQEKPTLSSLGEFKTKIQDIKIFSDQFLNKLSLPFSRLAFGSVLMQTVSDVDEGKEIISQFTPLPSLEKETSDLFFQLNHPQQSTEISDLMINRLTKWSTLKMELSDNNQKKYPEQLASVLELDINTDKDYKKIEANQTTRIFNELIDKGLEISQKGIC